LTVGIQLRGQEDEAFLIASIRDDDIDVDESFGATLRVQLSVHNGQIQLSKFSGFKAGVQRLFNDGVPRNGSFSGSVENLNEALSTATYTGDENWHGTDTLLVVVSDFGRTGASDGDDNPEYSVTKSVSIVISAMNDQPKLV
jgi:hypothetical protein